MLLRIKKGRKSPWGRSVMAAVGILLTLNLSPAFCACLNNGMSQQRDMGREMGCHCPKSPNSTPQERGDRQAPSSAQADTCPLCSCAFSASGTHSQNAVVAKSAAGGHAAYPAVLAPADRTLLHVRFEPIGTDPPGRMAPHVPIHLLNRAFLL